MSKLMREKEFPYLDIKERTGWTDYIDFIDETYKTLKTPLQLARKWFTMR